MAKTQRVVAFSLALLTAFPCAVQAFVGYTHVDQMQDLQFEKYMSCKTDGSVDQTVFTYNTPSTGPQSACQDSMIDKGFRWYSYMVYDSQTSCITTPICEEADVTVYSVDAASNTFPTTISNGGVAPDSDDNQNGQWRIKLQICGTIDGTAVSTCADSRLSVEQKTACTKAESDGRSGSYPCACGTAMCTDGQVCQETSNTCATPCDASAAPDNGLVGDCSSFLASGDTCQPTCNTGYTVSGSSSCALGVLTAATCGESSCDASAAPANGAFGDCTSTLASGATCQPTCNTGYTVSGSSSCSLGVLTAATCGESSCDASAAPGNGAFGDCTSTLASGATCQPTCNTGYTVSGSSSCSFGVLTAATCGESSCDASAAPENGAVGDCTSSLASGDTCQPVCNSGYSTANGIYHVSGSSSCSLGVLTAATCDACCCPMNRRIDDEDECRDAIKDQLGLSSFTEYSNSATDHWTYKNGWLLLIPPGCSYSTGTEPGMHFEGVSGQHYPGFEPVCKLCKDLASEDTCKQASCAWSGSACVECSTFSESECTLAQCTWSSDSSKCQPTYVITTGSMVTRQATPCESIGLTRLDDRAECFAAGDALGLVDSWNHWDNPTGVTGEGGMVACDDTCLGSITSQTLVQNGCIWKDQQVNNLNWMSDCGVIAAPKASEPDQPSICKVSSQYDGSCSYDTEQTNIDALYLTMEAVAQGQDTSAWASAPMMIGLGVSSLLGVAMIGRWMRRRATSSRTYDAFTAEQEEEEEGLE